MNNYPKTALVVNCGSSSVKFAILDPKDGHVFLNGLAEALGLEDARISWKFNGGDKTEQSLGAGADHKKALEYLVKNVLAKDQALLDSIVACGHRIVQGGDIYSEPTLINDEVEENIRKVIPFAPLHNPAHLLGIDAARANFPSIPHVAVFDTAFHQTMPPKAYRYAIPEEYYTDLHLRKYGAHGTSHMFLSQEAAKLLGKPLEQTNIITCHLGNGASVSAVKGGKCIDTSMGLTPLDGLIMGTRCGSIDASVVFFLCDKMGMTPEEVKEVFNKKSGMLAASGVSSDFRPIVAGYNEGNERCKLALEMYAYRLAKFIASYYVPLGHVDAIVLSGGVGENGPTTRKLVLKELEESFGVKIDEAANEHAKVFMGVDKQTISAPDSSVKVFVIATNEELMIARSAMSFVK
ncbi:MAG: acetate kinase [Succinivibrio dextrinosolvens]|uniref:acetate kinase n=1 Tax=Succinivibrio sp. TaxID=2053619 RepID=UPI0025F292EA|nr:acetate kinase [Succinivibrio sp.]MBQ9220974.1 acetate kinase [Succinivibrio sp.]MDY6421145.1 acetate kinase [Succinivibrio dextrinosolvens]MDY6466212.1 acetate kinase [Succinivibrio dextrinosolvens]